MKEPAEQIDLSKTKDEIDWDRIERIISRATTSLTGHEEFFNLKHEMKCKFEKREAEYLAYRSINENLDKMTEVVKKKQKMLRDSLFAKYFDQEEPEGSDQYQYYGTDISHGPTDEQDDDKQEDHDNQQQDLEVQENEQHDSMN